MRLFVDADSFNAQARALAARAAEKRNVHMILVANRPIPLPAGSFIKLALVEAKKEAADLYIIEHCRLGDMVLTRDISLAAQLAEKGLAVLNDCGDIFTKDKAKERLSERNFALKAALAGFQSAKRHTYGKNELARFANAFDKTLTALLKKASN